MKPSDVESLSRPKFINEKIEFINDLIDEETRQSLLEAEDEIKKTKG